MISTTTTTIEEARLTYHKFSLESSMRSIIKNLSSNNNRSATVRIPINSIAKKTRMKKRRVSNLRNMSISWNSRNNNHINHQFKSLNRNHSIKSKCSEVNRSTKTNLCNNSYLEARKTRKCNSKQCVLRIYMRHSQCKATFLLGQSKMKISSPIVNL